MNISSLSAQEILEINSPSRLFDGDPIKSFKDLVKIWHPDINNDPLAGDVVIHLTSLRNKISTWRDGREIILHDGDSRYRLTFLKTGLFELGTDYVSKSKYTLVIDDKHSDLIENANRIISHLHFANDRMKKEMTPWLPSLFYRSLHIGVFNKPQDYIKLSDLHAHYGNLDAEHVAWILSGMYHVACYLSWTKLTHNAIGPQTWFVSPSTHSGMLLGGWEYSRLEGQNLVALPPRTARIAPSSLIRDKTATSKMDRELIKLTGRELLGDPTGVRLRGKAPDPIVDFLVHPAASTSVDDYAKWKEVLRRSFGPPKFVELAVSPEDVY